MEKADLSAGPSSDGGAAVAYLCLPAISAPTPGILQISYKYSTNIPQILPIWVFVKITGCLSCGSSLISFSMYHRLTLRAGLQPQSKACLPRKTALNVLFSWFRNSQLRAKLRNCSSPPPPMPLPTLHPVLPSEVLPPSPPPHPGPHSALFSLKQLTGEKAAVSGQPKGGFSQRSPH